MAMAKLSDKIVIQFIIMAFTIASIKGTHSIENLVVSTFPNSLHNIAAANLYGADRGDMGYILVFSHLICWSQTSNST